MTPIDTAELERLAEEITPGPWAVDSEDQGAAWGMAYSVHVAGNILDDIADSVSSEANACAIALVPALISEVLAHRRLREVLQPFAAIADIFDSEVEGHADTDELSLFYGDGANWLVDRFTLAQFNAARAALSSTGEK